MFGAAQAGQEQFLFRSTFEGYYIVRVTHTIRKMTQCISIGKDATSPKICIKVMHIFPNRSETRFSNHIFELGSTQARTEAGGLNKNV